MAQTLDIQVEGLDQIEKNLEELDQNIRRKVVRSATRRTGRPLVRMMRRNIRANDTEDSGALYKSIRVWAPRSSKSKSLVYVGPNPRQAPHAHLVEFGSGPRYTSDGQYRGEMPPAPYARPAWDEYKSQVIAEMINNLNEMTVREIRKLGV